MAKALKTRTLTAFPKDLARRTGMHPDTERILKTLKTTRLEMVDGVEVVMSRVQVPPDTTLPKHYHPGEEFIYVLGGSGTMWLADRGDMPLAAGDAFTVPFKAVHTFTSGPDGARILVCRVHEAGQPMRITVEDQD